MEAGRSKKPRGARKVANFCECLDSEKTSLYHIFLNYRDMLFYTAYYSFNDNGFATRGGPDGFDLWITRAADTVKNYRVLYALALIELYETERGAAGQQLDYIQQAIKALRPLVIGHDNDIKQAYRHLGFCPDE